MIEFALKLVLALVFAGVCAWVYLRLARNRKNVRRESALVFISLLLFSFVRLILA